MLYPPALKNGNVIYPYTDAKASLGPDTVFDSHRIRVARSEKLVPD